MRRGRCEEADGRGIRCRAQKNKQDEEHAGRRYDGKPAFREQCDRKYSVKEHLEDQGPADEQEWSLVRNVWSKEERAENRLGGGVRNHKPDKDRRRRTT